MAEQLLEYGTVVALRKDPNWCLVTDGYYTVNAYIPNGITIMVGKSYMVHKRGTTYFVGQEIQSR
jgi:hypothetical protein